MSSTRSERARWSTAWALVAVAGLGLMALDGYLPHTDDGCAVETHCVVCSGHIGTAAVVAAQPTLPQPFALGGRVPAEACSRPAEFTAPVSAARGPPSV